MTPESDWKIFWYAQIAKEYAWKVEGLVLILRQIRKVTWAVRNQCKEYQGEVWVTEKWSEVSTV